MNDGLAGKVALVTGASRGIGAAIARELAGAGVHVALAGRDESTLQETARSLPKGNHAVAVKADVADTSDLDRLVGKVVAELGGIDVLVNNAGLMPPAKQIYNADLDEWQEVMNVNLRAPWYLSKLVHPHMKARGGGAIVNVSSTSGLHHDIGLGVYGISKAGVVMLTEVCAKEWARDNIRVNCIAPGIIKTQLAGSIIDYLKSRNMKPNPMNLYGEPEDIAKLVRFLASDDSRYMTGSIIRIDGGELL
ncbi:MAG TPA: SDR family oxidoreductase [Candidatus Dormibacteraeota bacterium]|nr:SDR family oxidoreductase [Candidatus Dormibacteraeota bacterium]